MKYNEKRINNTDCHIFTADLDHGLLTLTREWKKTKIENIDHDWYEANGWLPLCAINGPYFGFGIIGGFVVDSGYYSNQAFLPNKKFSTLIYQGGQLHIDESYNEDYLRMKYKGFVFMMQAGNSLVKNGSIYLGDGNFDHTFSRHPRTFIGQLKNGEIVMFTTDGRGGNDKGMTIPELAQVALDMGCVTAMNMDGGGSSTMAIEGEMVNDNENRPSYAALMFYAKKGYDLERLDGSTDLCIDMGHSIYTSGKRTPSGVREAQQNYPIGYKLKELLKDDYSIVMTNTNMAYDMSRTNRVAISNNAKARLFLSIHKDAIGSGSEWRDDVEGFSCIVCSMTSKSIPYAEAILKELEAATGMKNRGIFVNGSLTVLKRTKAPAIVIELGYMTNRIEAAQMDSEEWFNIYANAIAKAVKSIL